MAARQQRNSATAAKRAQGLKTAEDRKGKRIYKSIWAAKLANPEFKALSYAEQEAAVSAEWKSRVTLQAARPKAPKPVDTRRDDRNRRGGGSAGRR